MHSETGVRPVWRTQQPPASSQRAWRIQGGSDLRYDDNILFLSSGSIESFRSGRTPQLYRIHSVGDVVFSPWAEVRRRFGRSDLVLGGRLNRYANNGIRDYEVLHVSVDHRRDRRNSCRMTYRTLLGGYAGELTNRDSGDLESVFYDNHELEFRYLSRRFQRVTLAPRQTVRLRVYDHSLDNPRTRASLDAHFPAYIRVAPWLRVDLDLDAEYLHALTPRDDYNPSAVRFQGELGTFIEPAGTRFAVAPSIRYGQRRFTTSQGQDTAFHGRTDTVYQLAVDLQYRFSSAISLRAGYQHDQVKAGVVDLAEEDASSARNLYSAALTLDY